MGKRRTRAQQRPDPTPERTSLVCPECHRVYHGPHTGDTFDVYGGGERPSYNYSQGVCSSRTCIRSQARKHQEHLRSRYAKHSKPAQPDSFWRTRAQEHEEDVEKAVRAGNPMWGIPPSEVEEDWGTRAVNPDVRSTGAVFTPLEPPINWDEEGVDA